jgi:hypothetical protein
MRQVFSRITESRRRPRLRMAGVYTAITHLLAEHTLDQITVGRGEDPPEQSSGGKYRTIVSLPRGATAARSAHSSTFHHHPS